ncbi:MAG: hypothetical protein F6K19_34780 [Cyanothece sp. SIO1E1]|nr:hypothetical protein [Cyanothece sp. SIO1E1]
MKRLLTALMIAPATVSISTYALAQEARTPGSLAYIDRTDSVQNVQQSDFRERQLASNLDGVVAVEATQISEFDLNAVSSSLRLRNTERTRFESHPSADIGELLDVPIEVKSSGGIRFGL